MSTVDPPELAKRFRGTAQAIRNTAAEVSILDAEAARLLAKLARNLIERAEAIEREQRGLPPLGLDDPYDRLRGRR